MQHGNKKYDLTPLANNGGVITATPSNIYGLKSSIRNHFGKGTTMKDFKFEDNKDGSFTVTRINLNQPTP